MVIIPELIDLTNRFITELIKFVDFTCKNELIVEHLRSRTTIEDYYKELEELIQQAEQGDLEEELKTHYK